MKIMFVCTGNTCRSAIAEGCMKLIAEREGLQNVKVSSSGLGAFPGDPASDNAIRAAARLGVDLTGHAARPFSLYLAEQADRIYTMTLSQALTIKNSSPKIADKVQTLAEEDIYDPFGGDIIEYDRCAVQIFKACRNILEELKRMDWRQLR